MKPISVHVEEKTYDELKSLATRSGRPVAELVREAMVEYLGRERTSGRSVLDIEPIPGGRLKAEWTRSTLLDEALASSGREGVRRRSTKAGKPARRRK